MKGLSRYNYAAIKPRNATGAHLKRQPFPQLPAAWAVLLLDGGTMYSGKVGTGSKGNTPLQVVAARLHDLLSGKDISCPYSQLEDGGPYNFTDYLWSMVSFALIQTCFVRRLCIE